MWIEIAYIVGAYLIGSVTFAIVICKLSGSEDPRHAGSGNPGATNVARVGGWSAAAITFIGDTAKSAIPLGVALHLGIDDWVISGIALAVFLGHLFPVYHRFKGGKGVATYLGVLIGTQPVAALMWVGGWLALVGIFRHSSIGGMTMCAVAPLLLWWQSAAYQLIAISVLMSVLVVIRHRQNIKNLIAGTEGQDRTAD